MIRNALPLLLAALLLAPAVRADETAEANASRFLDSLTRPRGEAQGRHSLHVRMVGVQVGTMDISINRVMYNDNLCYRVQTISETKVPGMATSTISVAYLDSKMRVIWAQKLDRDGNDVAREGSTIRTENGYVVQRFNKSTNELIRKEYEGHDRVLSGYAEELAILLLAAAPSGSYAFVQWDAEAEKYAPLTVTVDREAEFQGKPATHLRIDTEYTKVLQGQRKESRQRTADYWLADGEFLHANEHDEGVELSSSELPTTREQLSPDALDRLDTPEAALIQFLVAMSQRDEDLLRKAMDCEAVARRALRENEQTRALPEETIEEFLPGVIDMMVASIMGEKEDGSVEAVDQTLVLAAWLCRHKGVVSVRKAVNGELLAGPAPDMPTSFTDDFPWFVVKQEGDGPWRIVHLYESGRPKFEGEEESANPEEEPAEKPDAPKEEGF